MNSNDLIFIIFHIFNKTNLYSSQNERDYQEENIAQYYSNYVNKTYPFDKLIWKFSQRDESHSCSEMFCHRNRLMEDNFELLFQYSVYYVSIACLLIVIWFLLLFNDWPENERTMIGKWPDDDRKMSRQSPENDRTMTGKWPDNDRTKTGKWSGNDRTMIGQWPENERTMIK